MRISVKYTKTRGVLFAPLLTDGGAFREPNGSIKLYKC